MMPRDARIDSQPGHSQRLGQLTVDRFYLGQHCASCHCLPLDALASAKQALAFLRALRLFAANNDCSQWPPE